MNVKILTDSACDLRKEYFDKYSIEMVPLTVHLGDEDYRDNIDISPKTIYDAMRDGASTKTSQVSPQTFEVVFTKYAKENKPLVYLAFSSELSGTFQTAHMMKQTVKEKYPEAPLYVLDTKCASIGFGLVVIRAAKLAQKGATAEEILEQATTDAKRMEHIFTVDDLDYLYRGGRVSRTAAFVGSLLNIKPVLHVEDGKLIPLERVRGSKRVLQRMIDLMKERGTNLSEQTIGISHGDDIKKAEKLAAMIRENFDVKDIVIEMVGTVIGAHSGPGTLALFFLNDNR